MSIRVLHVNFTKYTQTHFVAGLNKIKSILYGLPQIAECIRLKCIRMQCAMLIMLLKNKKYVIVEYPQTTKKMISLVKSNLCNLNTLNILLFKILVQESIGNVKVFKPFWNSQCQINSRKLWLPTETDYADSHSNSFSGSWKKIKSNSWFSMKEFNPQNRNLLKTFYQSSTSSLVDKWEKDVIKKRKRKRKQKTVKCCKKIRFLPTEEQQKYLREWNNTARYTYNKTIHKINSEKQKINFYDLRNKLVPKKVIPKNKMWITNTPKEIRANAVKEVVTAYKACFSNLKNNNIKYFKMSYRSKKTQTQESISVPKQAIKKLDDGTAFKLYSRTLKSSIKLHHETILENFNSDIRIIHIKKCNLWYLCVPYDYNINSLTENQGRDGNIVSIDPGTKTFLTLYDYNGHVYKLGNDDIKFKLIPIYKKIDKLKSLTTKRCSKTKYNIKRRIRKQIYKFKNYIQEIHYKSINFLLSRYSTILIPHLVDKRIIKNMFSSSNRRNLLSWNHSKFLTILEHQAKKYNKNLVIVSEEFTSKTCGSCGNINYDLGNKDIYCCNSCKVKIDRDINGARNILLKNL